jgi:hypothetical protein
MANYREEIAQVTTWLRAKRVTMLNPLGGVGEVIFEEERATQVGGDAATLASTGVLKRAFDPERVIPIFDPVSGVDTETTMTEGQIFAALYSVYLQMAMARDAT